MFFIYTQMFSLKTKLLCDFLLPLTFELCLLMSHTQERWCTCSSAGEYCVTYVTVPVSDVLFACNLCFQCLSDNGSVLDTQVLGYHQQCHKSQGCCVSYTSLFVYFCDQYQQQHWEESPLLACIFLNIPCRCVCLSVLISHLFNLNSKCRWHIPIADKHFLVL